MSLVKNVIQDFSGLGRQAVAGDIITTNESVPAANTSTALTFTGALLAQSIFLANPGAAATFTIDSAANVLAAIAPSFAYNVNASAVNGTQQYSAVENNTSWRIRIVNASANAITINSTANTGVTVNRGSVAASASRDFLVTVRAGMQAQSFVPVITNGTATLQLTPAQAALLTNGMVITNSVAGLQGQTITSVNTTTGVVTMSGNATASTSTNVVNFSPVIQIDGL